MATKSAKKRARNEAAIDKAIAEAEKLEELKGVEILRAGVIRGREYKATDLQEIAENTNRLIKEELHNPPGKLGHDDSQAFARASGLPATGWVERLRVIGDKLVADFADVPKLVMRAMREKLFRKISSEIYFDFPHPKTGDIMGKVLRAVAFLGADIPEVKGLGDYLGEGGGKIYAFAEGEYENLGDINVSISVVKPEEEEPEAPEIPVAMPHNPAIPVMPAPGPLVAEGLAGRDLELFRQAEKVVEELAGESIPEFDKDRSVDSLLRYAGRVGAGVLLSSPGLRGVTENPEELTAWLLERAGERGLVETLADIPQKGVSAMDATKLEEETKRANDAEAKANEAVTKLAEAQAELDALKAKESEREVEKRNADIAAFVEKHKEYLTPAIEPSFKALCESAPKAVKLSEKEEISGLELCKKFVGDLIAAKVAKFEELAKNGKGNEAEPVAVKGANYRQELHSAAVSYQEAHKGVSYMDAVSEVLKEKPELAKGE